jgi:YidC/Oxa1 family membrane protein insertase
MDKNSIIGLCIIGLIILAYGIYTQPGEEEIKAMNQRKDSLALVEARKIAADSLAKIQPVAPVIIDTTVLQNDSLRQIVEREKFGVFSTAAAGSEQLLTLENNKLKITISSLGGKIKSAELKNYKTSDQKPLLLMSGDSSDFNVSLSAQNRIINTRDLYFQASGTSGKNNSVSLRVIAGENKYIEYLYSLEEDSYLLNFKISVNGMQDIIASNASYLNVDWKESVRSQEKSIGNERPKTTVYYRFSDEDVDYLSETSDEKENLKTKVKWIAFKQQFFSSVLIAENSFESPVVESVTNPESKTEVKKLAATFSLPYERKESQVYGMKYYLGPNHYQTLKKIDDLNLEKLIPLGWGIFNWVNRFLVIPTFNFLDSFKLNYGIIILLLTILVRIILLPLTYGSFKSQAKMKVLQPEISEINEKHKDDAMKKQQETMALYRKAGVNPLGGCIPGLLQLPILIAMFNFFPSSIELRQKSFLWADDLSTYDSILDLPFHIPAYGAHVSLFTLLMTVSTIIYTKMNMQMTASTNPQMKWMMYLMPIIFLGVFNTYSSGLSYYYFLSNIIGFGQQYLFKAFIDEDKIHAQIQENKKKPVKKSSFQARLEQMAKERGVQPPRKR